MERQPTDYNKDLDFQETLLNFLPRVVFLKCFGFQDKGKVPTETTSPLPTYHFQKLDIWHSFQADTNKVRRLFLKVHTKLNCYFSPRMKT